MNLRKTLAMVLLMSVALLSVFSGAGAETSSQDVMKVHFWHFMDNPYEKEMALNFSMFKEENPGYEIEAEAVTGDTATAALQARIASGNAPDMWLTTAFGPSLAQFAEVAQDLTEQPIWSKVSELGQADVTYEGKKLAFPYTGNVYGLMYNKKVFEQAGITEIPKTLSGLREICEQLKAAGVTPFGMGFKDAWVGSQLFREMPFAFSFGGSVSVTTRFDEYLAGTAVPSEDGWPGKIVDMMSVVKEYCQPNPFSTDWPMLCQMLAEGKVAMIVQGDWVEGQARGFVPDCDISMALLPFSEDPADARVFVNNAGRSIVVSKDSENKEGAYKYLDWVSTSPSAINWYNNDLMNIAPYEGVMPGGDKAQLLSSAAALYTADSGVVSTWGGLLLPPDFFSSYPSIQEEFFADRQDKDAIVKAIDDSFSQYE